MKARPIMFLMASLYSSFIINVADRSVESKRYERRYNTSRIMFNVPGGQLRSMLHCATLCDRSPSCKAFCYSRSTALCHLSQPYDPIVQDYDVSESKCYHPIGCPMEKGYAWYGARCIKLYAGKRNYTVARAICTQDGGHLYHFKDLAWDMHPIVDLRAVVGDASWGPWVGADALETGGQFKWSDSSLLANDLSVWASGNPRSPANTCVWLDARSYRLHNDPCYDKGPFVCEVDV